MEFLLLQTRVRLGWVVKWGLMTKKVDKNDEMISSRIPTIIFMLHATHHGTPDDHIGIYLN